MRPFFFSVRSAEVETLALTFWPLMTRVRLLTLGLKTLRVFLWEKETLWPYILPLPVISQIAILLLLHSVNDSFEGFGILDGEVSEDWDDGATIDMPRQLTLSISSGAGSTTDDGGTVESDGSVTYALSDFGTSGSAGVRRGEDYQRNYFLGRYGGIRDVDLVPFLREQVGQGLSMDLTPGDSPGNDDGGAAAKGAV